MPKKTTVIRKVVEEETKRSCHGEKKVVIETPQNVIIKKQEREVTTGEILTPKANRVEIVTPKKTVVHREEKKVVIETPKKTIIHKEKEEEEPTCKEENVVIVKNVVVETPKKTVIHTKEEKKTEERRHVVIEEPKRTVIHREEKKVVIEAPKKTVVHTEEKKTEERRHVVEEPKKTVVHREEKKVVIETPKKTIIHKEKEEEEPTCKEENVVIVKNVVVETPKKTVIHTKEEKKTEERRHVVIEEPKRTVIHREEKKVVIEAPKKTVVIEHHKVIEQPKKTCEHVEEVVEKPAKKVVVTVEEKKYVRPSKVVIHAEIKKQIAGEVREKELRKIDRQTTIQIVKDMKRDAITRVREIYRKEKEACVDKTSELKAVLDQTNEELKAERSQMLLESLRVAEAEKKTSQIILDMLNKIKCTCAAARSHKKLMAKVLKKLQAVNPDAIIEFKLFRTKKALKQYLNSHHARYLRQLARGNRVAYTRRFHSWRVAYRTNRRLVSNYKAGYVYCNRSKQWIKTHSFRVNGKTCGCNKIVKKYRIYARRTRKYKRVLKRNHVSLRRVRRIRTRRVRRFRTRTVRRYPRATRTYRRVSYARHSVSCRKRTNPSVPVGRSYALRRPAIRVASCGRRLQATNMTNNNDVTLVQTFKDHLASFKVEDRSILAQCFA